MSDPTTCWPCVSGLHAECIDGLVEDGMVTCCCGGTGTPGFAGEVIIHGERQSGGKSLDEIGDIKSTGRKRAAQIAPIFDGMLCEWANLMYAGGGVEPIMGCRGNTIAMAKSKAEAKSKGADQVGRLHHGPDKNTLNNTPGVNLHRICEDCHQRWHALNNQYYEGERPSANEQWLPRGDWQKHDPDTQWTEDEYQPWLDSHGWK